MNPQSGTYNPQSGAGGGISLQGSSPQLQPTFNPQQAAGIPLYNGGGQTLGATTDTGSGYVPYDAAAAQAAADKAQKVAQANQLKGSINGIINNVKGVYDAIYGDLNVVGADKASQVQQRYNNENTALVDQFSTEFPSIGNAYAGRGAYDSSYRQDAEAGATRQFNNMQNDLVTGRNQDLSKVGEYVAGQRAQVGADRSSLDNMAAMIANSEDPAELQQIQQQISDKLGQVTASRAGLQSQDAYRATADQLVSTADRSGALKQTLGNIISGAAPSALKRSVAGKLIQSSGLSPDEQAMLVSDFEKQLLNGTDQTVVPQG